MNNKTKRRKWITGKKIDSKISFILRLEDNYFIVFFCYTISLCIHFLGECWSLVVDCWNNNNNNLSLSLVKESSVWWTDCLISNSLNIKLCQQFSKAWRQLQFVVFRFLFLSNASCAHQRHCVGALVCI